jgi:regulatory protein
MAARNSRRPTSPLRSDPVDTALRFLATRPRSEAEVRRRLARAGFAAENIEAVLQRLRGSGLVDDEAFARYWVEQRQTFRPRGPRLLRAELRQHGISPTLPFELNAESDAYRAGAKRARTLRGVDERVFKNRLGQHLARRGFDWDVISPTVERLWREVSEVSTSSGSARAPTA